MPGETVGKYRLLKRLAKGGMGEVYLARQEGLKGFSKTVVVKRILDSLAEDGAFAEMFINEARLAALLTHPNIVQVFDLGEEDGSLYIAMEYVHGHSLRAVEQQLQRQGLTMPADLAARIIQLALLGLGHAHRAVGDDGRPLGLVHRDVSPDNILIGYDGSVKVTDFGIAKAMATQQRALTQAGTVKGKVAYMPPEQLKAEVLDARTDVYAMGVVLYELLSGQRPFAASTDTSLMLAIVQEPPRSLKSLVAGLDPKLERIVLKALEKEPQRRFATAEAMAEALAGITHSQRSSMEQTALRDLLVTLFGEEAARAPNVAPLEANATPSGQAVTRAAPRTGQVVELFETDSSEVPVALETKESQATPRPVPSQARRGAGATPPKFDGPATAPGGQRRVTLLAGLAVSLLVGAGGGVVVAMQGRRPKPQPVAQPAPPVERPAPPPVMPPEQPPELSPKPPAPTGLDDAAPQPAKVEPAPSRPEPPEGTEPKPVVAAARPGRVDLDVVPWGEVFVGKRSLGVTPLEPFTLPAGPQVLTVKNPDLKLERKVKVQVPAGGTVSLRINLLD